MLEKTRKLMDATEELMDYVMKELVDFDTLAAMDGGEFEIMKKYIKLYEDAKELALEQAEMMDNMNAKLDKILKAIESLS